MNMIKMIRNLKNLFLFFIPLSYITYILYIRIILVRDIRVLYIKLSVIQISITVLIILGICVQLFFLLKKEGFIKEKEQKSKLLLMILKPFNNISETFNKLWVNFYRFFVTKFVTVHMLVHKFGIFLGRHKTPQFVLLLIIIFKVLPKLLLVLIFSLDIFVFKQFYYFYKTLIVLLLPLIYTTLRSILLQFYEDNVDFFNDYIEKTYVITESTSSFRIKYNFVKGYKPPSFIKDLDDFLENHYFPIINIMDIIRFYDAVILYYKLNRLFIAILVLHLIGWLTILIFGIYI